MKLLDDYKRKKNKAKREKEKLRKYEQQLIEEEKRLEEEFDKEYPVKKEKPYELFLDLVFDDDSNDEDALELKRFETEKEKEEEEEEKKEIKKMYIKVGLIYLSVIIIFGIVVGVMYYYSIPPIIKETRPLLVEYYKDKFGGKADIENIEVLCKTNKETKEEECSDIVKADLKNGGHLFAINNSRLADDMSSSGVTDEYIHDFNTNLSHIGVLTHETLLSHKDFYLDFNMYYDYINVLPNNTSFYDLYNSNKLTVIDRIVHTESLDSGSIMSYISSLSDDSKYYFVRTIDQTPVTLSIVTKDSFIQINLLSHKNINDNFIYYELDPLMSKVSNVNVLSVASRYIIPKDENYEFINTYSIEIETSRNYDRNKEDTRTDYYFLHIKNGLGSNIRLFNDNRRGETSDELDVDNYPEFIAFDTAQGIYLIGVKSMNIGNVVEKEKGFICKYINIC